MELSGWVELRLDPAEPDRQAIPRDLWINDLISFLLDFSPHLRFRLHSFRVSYGGTTWTFFGLFGSFTHPPHTHSFLSLILNFLNLVYIFQRHAYIHTLIPAIPSSRYCGNAQTRTHVAFSLRHYAHILWRSALSATPRS